MAAPKETVTKEKTPAPAAGSSKEESKEEKAPASAAPAADGAAAKPEKRVKRRGARLVPEGRAYVQASYNNTIITITDPAGQVLTWTSAGVAGFKGTRKATPYAASVAAENVTRNAKAYGLERVHVFVSGVGSGREQAIRSLQSNGLNVLSITDTTPLPHNGVRQARTRRV